jgi:hypothetical protein
MAVLVEALSVIVRREAIVRKDSGGWSAFVAAVSNETFCADSELVRVGFILRGPGYFDTDPALRKNTRLTERFSLQLRIDAFNAFNTVSFTNPGQIVGASSFGKITSQAGTPRILQLSGKILF